jgi:hypothetical protein
MDNALLKELDANKPVDLSEQRTFLKAFIYGDWGVGKTVLACSSGKRTLIITSGDGGESSLRNHPEYKDNCSIIQCQGLSHIKAIFKAIEEGHPDYKEYEVVVIDTISSICEQYLKNLVDNYDVNKDRHVAKPKKAGSVLEAEGMGDYKFLAAHMRDLAPVSSAAPVDVVWLSHEREPSFTDEAKGNYLVRPKMPEKASDAVAEVCHVVGNYTKKKAGQKITRELNFSGSNRLAAKSRIAELEDKTITVDKFWETVERWRNS